MNAREEWIERGRAITLEQGARALDLRLPRRGELQAACPNCGGDDRFSINLSKGVWNCRGAKGGNDAIGMVMHARDCEFLEAIEFLLGEAAPGREGEACEADPEIIKERKEERRDEAASRARAEDHALEQAIERATALWNDPRCRPLAGTIAEDYFERRGIEDPCRQLLAELRFHPAVPYRGYPSRGVLDERGEPLDPDREILFGEFFAILAPLRGADGRIRGVQRTYIAPDGSKLKPPGDRSRNKGKKAAFRPGGGLTLLARGGRQGCLAVAEGIENALAWKIMADEALFGEDYAGWGIASAYSLDNLCGRAADTIPHPRPPKGRPSARISNGVYAGDGSGFPLPPWATRVLLLGDADSDPIATRAKLLTGCDRLTKLGVETGVHMAPSELDWNDALLDWRRERAVA